MADVESGGRGRGRGKTPAEPSNRSSSFPVPQLLFHSSPAPVQILPEDELIRSSNLRLLTFVREVLSSCLLTPVSSNLLTPLRCTIRTLLSARTASTFTSRWRPPWPNRCGPAAFRTACILLLLLLCMLLLSWLLLCCCCFVRCWPVRLLAPQPE